MPLPAGEDRARGEAATGAAIRSARAACDPDERARWFDRAVELNLALAGEVADRFGGRGVEIDDLRQIAGVGLVKAVRRFTGSGSFRAFARPVIEGELQQYLRDRAQLVRLPRELAELHPPIARARRDLAGRLGRPPTVHEIAGQIGAPPAAVAEAMAAEARRAVLPDEFDQAEDDGDELAVRISQLEAAGELRTLLRCLDRRDRLVLRLRYLDEWSQQDIGQLIGVSQAQVSRMIKRALERARAVRVAEE